MSNCSVTSLLRETNLYPIEKTLIIDCKTIATASALARQYEELKAATGYSVFEIQLLGKALYPILDVPPKRRLSWRSLIEGMDAGAHHACLVEHRTNTCTYLSAHYTLERLGTTREDYLARPHNMLWFWRDSLDDFDQMLKGLRQNQKIENFKHRLRRPDGHLCEYVAYQIEVVQIEGMFLRKSTLTDEFKIIE